MAGEGNYTNRMTHVCRLHQVEDADSTVRPTSKRTKTTKKPFTPPTSDVPAGYCEAQADTLEPGPGISSDNSTFGRLMEDREASTKLLAATDKKLHQLDSAFDTAAKLQARQLKASLYVQLQATVEAAVTQAVARIVTQR